MTFFSLNLPIFLLSSSFFFGKLMIILGSWIYFSHKIIKNTLFSICHLNKAEYPNFKNMARCALFWVYEFSVLHTFVYTNYGCGLGYTFNVICIEQCSITYLTLRNIIISDIRSLFNIMDNFGKMKFKSYLNY